MATILVDATHAAKTGARTGAQTVVRCLLWGLSKHGADLQMMRWSKWRNGLVPLNQKQKERLGAVQGIEGRFKKGALKGPIKMRTSGSTSRSTPTH